jgi:alpha-tubulin suppressor-like RCC1 family protein
MNANMEMPLGRSILVLCALLGGAFSLAACSSSSANESTDAGGADDSSRSAGDGSGATSKGPDSSAGDDGGDAETGATDPGDLAKQHTATAVSVGSDFACAVTAAGGVDCWGSANFGELGSNPGKLTASGVAGWVPAPIVGLTSTVAAVSAGNQSACALTTGGAVMCWGYGGTGDLGNGSTNSSEVPVQVTGLASGAKSVAVGDNYACAVTGAGGVVCWGNNDSGVLGNNSTAGSLLPVQVVGLASGVASVSTGMVSACAVTAGGAVMCWGDNTYGELGIAPAASPSSTPCDLQYCSLTPVQVTGLTSGVTSVSVGAGFACALSAEGDVLCWGRNLFGGLGNGSDGASDFMPTKVVGLPGAASAVSATNGWGACAIVSGGDLLCWGDNRNDELGNGTEAPSCCAAEACAVDAGSACFGGAPTQVQGLTSGVTSVSEGGCAVAAGGKIECWGANFSGQLGNNSDTISTVPVPVIGFP